MAPRHARRLPRNPSDAEVVGEGKATGAKSLEVRRKRLRFRSWHRGTKEVDLLLGNFADRYLDSLTPEQLDRYEALLEFPDPQIYVWMIGRAAPPPALDHDVMQLLRNFQIHK